MNRILIVLAMAGLVCGCATGPKLMPFVTANPDGTFGGAGAKVQYGVVQDPPLTTGEKWLRAGGILAGAVGAGLVLQNNEWGAFESKNEHDEPAGNTYNVDGEQVIIVEGTGGAVTIEQEDNDAPAE
jgi:hypothetical protein